MKTTPSKSTPGAAKLRALRKPEKIALALKAGTTLGYVNQLAYTGQLPSKDLAERIEAASFGAIKKTELRPDLNWKLIDSAR